MIVGKSDVALAMHHGLLYSTLNNMRKIKQYVKYAFEQLHCWIYTVSCNCLDRERTVGHFAFLFLCSWPNLD